MSKLRTRDEPVGWIITTDDAHALTPEDKAFVEEILDRPWLVRRHGWPYWAIGERTPTDSFPDPFVHTQMFTSKRTHLVQAWRGRSRTPHPVEEP